MHGAKGYSQDLPVASWSRHARAARIADGPDEVHVSSVAREFLAGHVSGAVNLPLEELGERVDSLARESRYVVYDRDGKRSSEAARRLAEAGHDVKELSGGISVWVAMRMPLEM